jgi:hypothetical protein
LREWSVGLVSKKPIDTPPICGLSVGFLRRTVTEEETSWNCAKSNLLNPVDEGWDFQGRVFDAEWFAQIADKPELAEDLEFLEEQATQRRDALDVVIDLTRRWQQSTPPKIRPPRDGASASNQVNGRVIRLLRPRSQGLVLIYPMVLDTKDSSEDPRANPTKPMIGVAVSLPTSHTATGVEYVVGKIWDAQQLAELNDEE